MMAVIQRDLRQRSRVGDELARQLVSDGGCHRDLLEEQRVPLG